MQSPKGSKVSQEGRQERGFIQPQAIFETSSQLQEDRNNQLKETKSKGIKRKIAYVIFIVICATLIAASFRTITQSFKEDFQKQHSHRGFPKKEDHSMIRPFVGLSWEHTPFKKILWLYSPTQLQAYNMQHAIVGQNILHFGKMDGFEVRVVNDLNAYNWLSNETINFIKRTHQRSVVDIPVYELLRLALLYQHGGVSIRVQNITLMHGIGWAQEIMKGSINETYEKSRSCGILYPEVVMLHRDRTKENFELRDDVIIARPYAKLFITLLNDMAKIIQDGVWPYYQYNVTTVNKDTEVVSFPGLVEALLNVYQTPETNLCKQFGVESFHQSKDGFIISIEEDKTSEILHLNEANFKQKYGKAHMLWLNSAKLVQEILKFLKKGDLSLGRKDSIINTKLMMAEGNKWLTAPPKTHRKVHFCIVSLKPQDSKEAQKSAKDKQVLLGKQSFSSWNLVHFVNGLPSASKKVSERTVLVNASVYEGLNLQRAVTKHCRNDSIVFLLDHEETLTSETDLQTLAKQFQPIGNFAAFLKIKTSQQVYQYKLNLQQRFTRKFTQPNATVLNDLANSLRAFTAQSYLWVPYFDLCQATTGRYFDREIPFLTMIQVNGFQSWCEQNDFYILRRIERLMDLPKKKIRSSITINSNHIKVVNANSYERYEYWAKIRVYSLCQVIYRFKLFRANIDNLVVFNNGKEVKGVEERKGMPQLIPRKIHQVWIKGEIPAFKQFLIKRLKDSHPNYEYLLWTQDNITRQNFPSTYDIIQKLIKFDKNSPYNKMPMLADLVRYEATYNHGGFYVDTNYMLLNNFSFDKLLTYSFFAGSDETFLNRADRNNGFYGVSQRNPRIARLLDHRMLSSRRHFSRDVNIETGPGLFGYSLVGDQELDQTVFLPPVQQIYPGYAYADWRLCQAPEGTSDSEILFKGRKKSYLKNCSEIFPFSIGVDFFSEGASWYIRRQ